MSTQTIWVAGKHRGVIENGQAWDLQGVFDSEALAEAACKTPEDFIGPVALNTPLPQEATSWPGVRYPLGDVAG